MDFYEIDCRGPLKVESVPTLPVWASTDERRIIYVEDVNQLYMGNDSNWGIILNSNTTFGGDLSGTYDAVVVADNSHSHIIANVTGLQTALNNKLPLTGKAADSDLLDGHDSSYFAVAGTLVTAGSIIASGGSNVPTGFLECNGAAISRTTYSDLFSAIGTNYGSGNESTTFNIPDLRGEFLRGWDHGRGADSGRLLGSYQSYQVQYHKHVVSWGEAWTGGTFGCTNNSTHLGTSGGADGDNKNMWTNDGTNYDGTVNAAGIIGTETRPRNRSVMYCIKY